MGEEEELVKGVVFGLEYKGRGMGGCGLFVVGLIEEVVE